MQNDYKQTKPADGQAYSESLARPFGNTAQYLPIDLLIQCIFNVIETVYDADFFLLTEGHNHAYYDGSLHKIWF